MVRATQKVTYSEAVRMTGERTGLQQAKRDLGNSTSLRTSVAETQTQTMGAWEKHVQEGCQGIGDVKQNSEKLYAFIIKYIVTIGSPTKKTEAQLCGMVNNLFKEFYDKELNEKQINSLIQKKDAPVTEKQIKFGSYSK